jgi:hypothetical protein
MPKTTFVKYFTPKQIKLLTTIAFNQATLKLKIPINGYFFFLLLSFFNIFKQIQGIGLKEEREDGRILSLLIWMSIKFF